MSFIKSIYPKARTQVMTDSYADRAAAVNARGYNVGVIYLTDNESGLRQLCAFPNDEVRQLLLHGER